MSWFFAHYGGSLAGIVETILRHPDRLVSDATQPDRIRFYRDLTLPLGGLAFLSPRAPADGCADDARQHHRVVTVRPADQVPVHVCHDRPDPDRLDRGGALPVAVRPAPGA